MAALLSSFCVCISGRSRGHSIILNFAPNESEFGALRSLRGATSAATAASSAASATIKDDKLLDFASERIIMFLDPVLCRRKWRARKQVLGQLGGAPLTKSIKCTGGQVGSKRRLTFRSLFSWAAPGEEEARGEEEENKNYCFTVASLWSARSHETRHPLIKCALRRQVERANILIRQDGQIKS